jgi:excisionase family DNA binding protein
MLSPRQIARSRGVAEITVYRWIRSGQLPSTRPDGRCYQVAEADLRRFMMSRTCV